MIEEKVKLKKFTRRGVLRFFGAAGLGIAATKAKDFEASAQTKPMGKGSSSAANLQGAGFYRFNVGDLECVSISDGLIVNPTAESFAAPRKELERILQDNFLPIDSLTLHINTLLIKTGGKVVLVDTGAGKHIGPTCGFLPANLRRAGFKAAEITDIVFSHAHIDHIGGNVRADGRMFFPNARFHIARREWDEGLKKTNYFGGRQVDKDLSKAVLDAIDRDLAPLKNRISFFETETEIAPGVEAIPAYGHTPGHAVYRVKSRGETLLFVGDLIHHATIQFTRPEITFVSDSYPEEAVAARRKILNRVAAERELMMGAHLPFPGIGHLKLRDEKGTGYEWIPVEWNW